MRIICIALFLHFFVSAPAQNSGTKKPVKDSLALNLLTTVDKVLDIARNEKLSGKAMAGEFIGMTTGEGPIYQSLVQLPGSRQTTCTQINTMRNEGVTEWLWESVIPSAPGTSSKEGVEKILQHFNIEKISYRGRPFYLSVYESGSETFIKLGFYKGLHNTEQSAVDSLVRLYKPLLSNRQTALDCSGRLGKAFETEGISKDAAGVAYEKLITQVAAVNIDAAFLSILGARYERDAERMKAALSYSQQQEIITRAKKLVEDYYASQNPKAGQADVVVVQKKETEKKNAPSDPCQREIWELAIKPGQYISGNGHICYVRDYSCRDNVYSLAWLDAQKNKIIIETNITVPAMASYTVSSGAPFLLCRNCNGVGYSMEHDWYQVSTGSNFYARSNDLRKYSCGMCSGRGYIKIR